MLLLYTKWFFASFSFCFHFLQSRVYVCCNCVYSSWFGVQVSLLNYSCRARHLATVAFSMYNSSRRGYPPEEGAHIAISECRSVGVCVEGGVVCNCWLTLVWLTGTIRRFLEHFGDEVDLVIFVSSDGNDVSGHCLNTYMYMYTV